MQTQPLSDLFDGGGLLVTPSAGESMEDLDRDRVVALFERHGVLLFRGFDVKAEGITTVTDRYTESYSADALRRPERFGQKAVHDVDRGTFPVPLHSEASFAPAWPEIVWFYCHTPPRHGGSTTLCDGVRLWKMLFDEAQSEFLAEPVCYELEIPLPVKQPGEGREPWVSNEPGANGYVDWDAGTLRLRQLRYAVQESRLRRRLAFANHLLLCWPGTADSRELQVKRITMAGGRPLRVDLVDDAREKAEALTYEIVWQERDLAMIDNARFMHGRRTCDETTERDIVNVQSARASFAYGTTTRGQVWKR